MCIEWLIDLFAGTPGIPEVLIKRDVVDTCDSLDPSDDTRWADCLDDMDQKEVEGFYAEKEW